MSEQLVGLQIEDKIARISLQRPDASNAFTYDMLGQLLAALREATASSDVLVLSAIGEDFSVGRDRADHRADVSMFESFTRITDVNTALTEYPGISLTLARGKTFGLGIGLVMRSDIALVSSNTRFALDEIKLGISPMFIMAEILEHLGPKQAADIIFSSREFGSEEAHRMGLVSQVIPDRHLDSFSSAYVEQISSRSPETLRSSKAYFKKIKQVPPLSRPAYALLEQIGSMPKKAH